MTTELICKCKKCSIKNLNNLSNEYLECKANFWKYIDNKNVIQAEHSLRTLIKYNKKINSLKKLGN